MHYLTSEWQLSHASIAQRMSWASRRQTSRLEDEAYSLLGLFGVTMPLIYGEGRKAFFRLQQELLDNIDDESLFAWGLYDIHPEGTGVLADSPRAFAGSERIRKTDSSTLPLRARFSVTSPSQGISIRYPGPLTIALLRLLPFFRGFLFGRMPLRQRSLGTKQRWFDRISTYTKRSQFCAVIPLMCEGASQDKDAITIGRPTISNQQTFDIYLFLYIWEGYWYRLGLPLCRTSTMTSFNLMRVARLFLTDWASLDSIQIAYTGEGSKLPTNARWREVASSTVRGWYRVTAGLAFVIASYIFAMQMCSDYMLVVVGLLMLLSKTWGRVYVGAFAVFLGWMKAHRGPIECRYLGAGAWMASLVTGNATTVTL